MGGWQGRSKQDIASKSRGYVGGNKDVVSFFFTNFPDRYRACDMYDIFSTHGKVVEVFIPAMKDGRRKRFGFVRFQDVLEPERMVIKLDNIFVEGLKIHVNLPRFDREVVPGAKHKEVCQHQPKESKQQEVNMGATKTWVKKQSCGVSNGDGE